jgi:hypothetical protein
VDDSGSRAEVHLPIPIDETGISWETDRNERYGHYQAENFNDQPEYRGGGTIKGYIDQDEHFLVRCGEPCQTDTPMMTPACSCTSNSKKSV